ncbi:hypothetical protein [Candidatus Hodgkinia cicadicola]
MATLDQVIDTWSMGSNGCKLSMLLLPILGSLTSYYRSISENRD